MDGSSVHDDLEPGITLHRRHRQRALLGANVAFRRLEHLLVRGSRDSFDGPDAT